GLDVNEHGGNPPRVTPPGYAANPGGNPSAANQNAQISAVRAVLDEALVRLRSIEDPDIDLRGADQALTSALEHAYGANANLGDYVAFGDHQKNAIEQVRSALAALQTVATEDPAVTDALGFAARALDALHRVVPNVGEEVNLPRLAKDKPLLPASHDTPRLLDPRRAVLRPAIPLAELPEPPFPMPDVAAAPSAPLSMQELEAKMAESLALAELLNAEVEVEEEELEIAPPEPKPDEALAREFYGDRLTEEQVLYSRARDLVEELAMFGLMRRQTLEEPWLSSERIEQRLVRRVDALIACGQPQFARLSKMLEERPVADPELLWANLFFFGSLTGDDSLDQVFRLIRVSDLEEAGMVDAVVDALSHAPHPGIDLRIKPWLTERRADTRLIGVRVAAARGTLTLNEALSACRDPDLRVVAAAAAALGTMPAPVQPEHLHALLLHPQERVAKAALYSALQRRFEAGRRRALDLLREGRPRFADAALVLGVVGRSEDLRPLIAAAASGEPVAFRALGWFGHSSTVDLLLGGLASDSPAIAAAAHEGLERITGAGLTKDVPAPEYLEGEEPFVRTDGPSTLILPDLNTDVEPWQAFWQRYKKGAAVDTRYRYGSRYIFQHSFREASNREAVRKDRRLGYIELTCRAGGTLPLDPDAFVARQVRQLGEWQNFVAHCNQATPGSWPCRFGA
ncbi:MAG: hypothetical protein AAGF12_34630, partial [Myxococcota bacterium]